MAAKNTSNKGTGDGEAEPTKKPKLSKKKKSTNKRQTQLTEDSAESSALWQVFDIDNSEFNSQKPTNEDLKSKGQIVFRLPHEVQSTNTNDDQTVTLQMFSQRKPRSTPQPSAYSSGGKNKSDMIVKQVLNSVMEKLTEREPKTLSETIFSEENLEDSVKETLNYTIRMCAEKHQNDEELGEVREVMEEVLKQCQDSKEPDLLQLSKSTEELKENVEGEKEAVEVSPDNNPLQLPTENLLHTFYKALTNMEEESIESSNKLLENLETEPSIEEGFCNGKSALWVSGVSEHVKACHLHGLFALFGKVDDVKIVANAAPPHNLFAYITMSQDKDAEDCIKYLNKIVFGGNKLCIKKTMTQLIYKEKITIKKEGQIPGNPAGEYPVLLQVKTKA